MLDSVPANTGYNAQSDEHVQANVNQQKLGFEGQLASNVKYNDGNFNEADYMNKDGVVSDSLYANSRAGFVRKVYSLLSIQLLSNVLICAWAMNSSTFQNIFVNSSAIIILSVLLMIVSIAAACTRSSSRKYGLGVLITFTLILGLLVGIICAITQPKLVLFAAGITAILVVSLTLYAMYTKTDLTGYGPYLFNFLIVMIIFGFALIFWQNNVAHIIYACISCLLFSFFLVYDTQLVLGKFQNAYTLDDAYFAAIQLYIDIIQIFLQILQILRRMNN